MTRSALALRTSGPTFILFFSGARTRATAVGRNALEASKKTGTAATSGWILGSELALNLTHK
eukprot:3715311-Alexandrium_andersonii.AAC.1